MSDTQCGDLIDLTIEDILSHSHTEIVNCITTPSTAAAPNEGAASLLILPLLQGRESLDNNPFDSLQKLANRPDDPFESMEKEACIKARSQYSSTDVKIANLLSLSGDDLLDNDETPPANLEFLPKEFYVPKFGSDATMCSVGSTIYHSVMDSELETDSPPMSLPRNSEIGSASSTDDCGDGFSAKSKKSMEQRKRLLKLSLSNSTFNSPLNRHQQTAESGFAENDNKCSPVSAILMEAANFGEQLLASESPLKFSDYDLMSDDSPSRAAERDFDADLEMLKIPMLKKLPSPVAEEVYPPIADPSLDASATSKIENTSTLSALPNLNALRARLRTKREEQQGQQDISTLIGNLKSLICNTNIVDDQRKQQANSLLETLTAALTSAERADATNMINDKIDSPKTPPQPIVRQGTFDLELQENAKILPNAEVLEDLMTQSTQSTHSVHSNPSVEEMPDVMFKSSATYDGDPSEDRGDLVLPVVEPATTPTETVFIPDLELQQQDVNDIIEQLTKLLGQHQPNSDNLDGSVGKNPTFIVVMNNPATQNNSTYGIDCSFSNAASKSDLHNSIRRRSQSLSTHDKLKILKLPLHLPPTSTASSVTHASENEMKSPPISTPMMNIDGPEFKTPSRLALRRNSFSSGTPYTPITSRYGASQAGSKMRRSNMMETDQHHAIVHPMQHLPNLNAFKPETRKKANYNTESILKSSGPMKATIPVKKVAPMIKISSPSGRPENRNSSNAGSSRDGDLNTSMHMLTKSGRMSYTSTPMPLSRSAGQTVNGAANYPSACSTPSVTSSSIRRSSTCITKSRYSVSAATPNDRPPPSPSAAASGLRRRTLTELKAKSPIKPRLSSISSSTSKPTASSSATRTSVTPASRVGNKQSFLPNYPRSSYRTNKRASALGHQESALASNKNKENKHS